MGRSMKGAEALDEIVTFRVTKTEKLLLAKMSGVEGHGAFLRLLIAKAARERKAKGQL